MKIPEIKLEQVPKGQAFIALTKDRKVQLFRKEAGLGPERFDSQHEGCMTLWEGISYEFIDHILHTFEYKSGRLKIYRALTHMWQDFCDHYTSVPSEFRTDERDEISAIAAFVGIRPIEYQAGFLEVLMRELRDARIVRAIHEFEDPPSGKITIREIPGGVRIPQQYIDRSMIHRTRSTDQAIFTMALFYQKSSKKDQNGLTWASFFL